jgi:predicted dienelactone hydrolase
VKTLLLSLAALVLALVGGATAAAGEEQPAAAKSQLRLPPPTGTRPIGTTTLYLTDNSRRDPLARERTQRRLVVQLWYPAATRGGPRAAYTSPAIASRLETAFALPQGTFSSLPTYAGLAAPIARGRHPLLLLSHGLGTLREFQTALASELASRGYIVAAIAHTYDAAAVEFANGSVVEGTAPAQPTESQRALLLRTRVGDVRFVLDELLKRSRTRTSPLAGRITPDRIGVLGHSLGGATAAAAMLGDPRIRAGLDLDGTMSGAVVAKGLRRPFMLIVGDHGGLTPDQAQFFRRLHSTRYALSLRGAGHYSFTDLPLFGAAVPGLGHAFDIGTINPLRAHATISAYAAAFFDRTLRGREATVLDGPSPAYPEVTFVSAEPQRTFVRRGVAA